MGFGQGGLHSIGQFVGSHASVTIEFEVFNNLLLCVSYWYNADVFVNFNELVGRMEQREHIRIQIPLGVEISHPAIGTIQTTARDISEGGVFVNLVEQKIKVGAKLKVKVLNLLDTDTQHTPAVDMQVARVTETGLGLSFTNKTAEHLWQSVERLREELQVGRDYFQVHQAAVLYNRPMGILLVQQDGKWLLPGHYLVVGEIGEQALRNYLLSALGLNVQSALTPLIADSAADISVLEAATFRVIYTAQVDDTELTMQEDTAIRDSRWVYKPRDLKELTFASEIQREAAEIALTNFLES